MWAKSMRFLSYLRHTRQKLGKVNILYKIKSLEGLQFIFIKNPQTVKALSTDAPYLIIVNKKQKYNLKNWVASTSWSIMLFSLSSAWLFMCCVRYGATRFSARTKTFDRYQPNKLNNLMLNLNLTAKY